MSNNWLLTERQKTIDVWLRSAVNFYGFVTPRAFLIVFNRYNTPKLLKSELMKSANKLLKQLDRNYCIWLDAIVNTSVPGEKIEEILNSQQGKKYYYPTETELLKYKNPNYYERTPQTEALFTYLCDKLGMNRFSAESFVCKLSWLHKTEEPVQKQIDLFEEYDFKMSDIDQAEHLYGLMADMSNHTRKWANCGFTPKEIFLQYHNS
ncbi:MAG: hypothetical protein GX345_00260 [Clostridiales bacterium]|nr:hypothetical protein [Clostridiales bacterium]